MGFRRVAALSMALLLVGVGCSDDPAGPLGSLPTLESLQNRLPPPPLSNPRPRRHRDAKSRYADGLRNSLLMGSLRPIAPTSG